MSDLEGFGPAISAWVVRHEIERRCEGAEVKLFAPLGHLHPVRADGGEPAEPLGTWTPARTAELAAALDCVVVTGSVVLDDDQLAALYGLKPDDVRARGLSRFLVEGLGPKLEARCPVVWQSVGLADDDDADVSVRLGAALSSRALVTVRDEQSRRRLVAAGLERDVTVLADPILLLPRLLAESVLAKRLAYVRLMGWYPAEGPVMVIQAGEQLTASVGELAGLVGDVAVVVVELGPDERGDEVAAELGAALGRDVFRMPAVASAEDIATALGAAQAGFVGISTHAAAAAKAYGRPAVVLGPAGAAPGSLADAYRAAEAAADEGRELTGLTGELDRHFDRVVEIGTDAARRRPAGAVADDGPPRSMEAMRRALADRAERAAAERATFADRVVDLEAVIARLEVEAGHLKHWGDAQAEARAAAEGEVAALRATRTFRWTYAARGFYSRLLGRDRLGPR